MATPGALANAPPDQLIQQIADGAIPSRLASELGVNKSSIYRHLATHPEYQRARKLGMEVRLDDAEMAVATADECTLPRAREMWRVVTWRAEREHPSQWGATNKLTGPDGGPVQVQVVRFGHTIDGEAVADVPNAAPLSPKLLPPA